MKVTLSKNDQALVQKIGVRAEEMAASTTIQWPAAEAAMVVTVAHLNGCPLKLKPLLLSAPGDFAQDMYGLRNNIDRKTGKLGPSGWRPKFEDAAAGLTPEKPAAAAKKKKPATKKPGPSASARAAAEALAEPASALALPAGKSTNPEYRLVTTGTAGLPRWTAAFSAVSLGTAIKGLENAAKMFHPVSGFTGVELYEVVDADTAKFIARATVAKDPSVRVSFDDQ